MSRQTTTRLISSLSSKITSFSSLQSRSFMAAAPPSPPLSAVSMDKNATVIWQGIIRKHRTFHVRQAFENGTKPVSGTQKPTVFAAGLVASPGHCSGHARGDQKEIPPNAATTKICIAIRSFDNPLLENKYLGLPPNTRKIGLPHSRVLYTVLRSPHVDKKSREQFHMEIKKQFLVIKTQPHEMRKKLFWLKRMRIFGAQYEIQLHCKTRLDKGKLQKLL